MSDSKPDLGTLAWGQRSGPFSLGRMTRQEKVKILINLAKMGVLEAFDGALETIGLMNAFGSDPDGLQPPDTALVRDALDFADEVQNLELMRHSWRTYYWAAMLGGYRKLEVDLELLFAASILHDVGIASGGTSEPRDCCFAVYGAERCKHHLVGKGHDRAKVRKIADAIGLHLNGYVSSRLYGAEAHLLSRGAMCDVFGFGRRRIDRSTRKQVFSDHPKGDLMNALEIWPGHHLRGTRGDFLIGIGGRKSRKVQANSLPQPGE